LDDAALADPVNTVGRLVFPRGVPPPVVAELSTDQIRLYRQALARRGASLARELADGAKPVPYLHVFALLDHLKQICDHPALALGTPDRFAEYESGKWDLFQEILLESLDGGEKVVVFTQYLGMIVILRVST
jgi:SNF2 family DNA or RNA helicase